LPQKPNRVAKARKGLANRHFDPSGKAQGKLWGKSFLDVRWLHEQRVIISADAAIAYTAETH